METIGLTHPYLVLSLELFLIGLLLMLGLVVLVCRKFRGERTTHPGERTQARARFAGGKEEAQSSADESERQLTRRQHAAPLPQAAQAVKKLAPPSSQHLADLYCPQCRQLAPTAATFCPYCGVQLVAAQSGQPMRLNVPPLPLPETAESFLDDPSSGTVPQQSLPSALHSPAPPGSDQSMVQLAPGMSWKEHLDVFWTLFSDGVQSSTGLVVGARSHTGIKRRHSLNEDSLFAAHGMQTRTAQPQEFSVFLVADGMGGHQYGKEASFLAIQTMLEWMLPQVSGSSKWGETELRHLLIEGVQAANQAIHRRNQEQCTDMGTTLTAAVVVGLTACVVNVGDSRTYLYRDSVGLRQITRDHSVVAYLLETGILTSEDIYTHPQRNQIYRSLGTDPLIQVDAFIEHLQPGDLLLLCTDGLWEMVRDPVIEQTLRSGTNPSEMSSALLEAALAGGGADNVSVIVVQVSEAARQTDRQPLAQPDAVEMPDSSPDEPKQSSRE